MFVVCVQKARLALPFPTTDNVLKAKKWSFYGSYLALNSTVQTTA